MDARLQALLAQLYQSGQIPLSELGYSQGPNAELKKPPQSPVANPGAYWRSGMVGYEMPFNDGVLNAKVGKNKLLIDWIGKQQEFNLHADKNGNAGVNYHRTF